MPGSIFNTEGQRRERERAVSPADPRGNRALVVLANRSLTVAALLVAVLVLVAPAAAAQVPAAGRARLARLLPEPRTAGATAEAARFYAADLYRYIDGAAEAYQAYGMVAMVHREYKAGDADVTVDIYDMGEPLNAFGIYSTERSPENRFIEMGAEGYVDQNVLNFLQGSFYVKLSAFSEVRAVEPLMRSFAGQISKRIGGGATLPAMLAILPPANRVAHSEKYVKKAPMGYEFLAPAFTAEYRFAGQRSNLLVSVSGDAAQARNKLESLKTHFGKWGKVAEEPAVAGAWRGSDANEGKALFFARSRCTVLLLNPPGDAAALLKNLMARIRE